MDVSVVLGSVTAIGLLGFVLLGGPVLLVDWVRARRQAVIARQIVLTEALDSRLGALVAPVVRKPLGGPWEVRIAMPPLGAGMLARILAVTDAVFGGEEGTTSSRYRMVLSVLPAPPSPVTELRRHRAAAHWTGTRIAAA